MVVYSMCHVCFSSTVEVEGLKIAFLPHLDGGGFNFGMDYNRIAFNELVRFTGPLPRCFEWCAGPAFISFTLLARGYCQTLALADVNPASVAAMKHTVQINGSLATLLEPLSHPSQNKRSASKTQ